MNGKVSVVSNRNCFPKMKDLHDHALVGRPIQAVKQKWYRGMVVSQKWCEIDTLLLHTSNRKYHMAYRFDSCYIQ